MLFIGIIHEIKGLDLLIKSFNRLKDNNLKLVIVGDDFGFKAELVRLIKQYNIEDKVIFTGVLTGNSKLEALCDCDIFIMPSRYESFTTSGLEAMACSKPLVLTENNHISSWVDGNVGLTCKFNEKLLANSIETLLNNESQCIKYGENGKKLIDTKYNWNTVEKQINIIYKNCEK